MKNNKRKKRISISAEDLLSITHFGIFCGRHYHPDKLIYGEKVSPKSMYEKLLKWHKRAGENLL